MKSPRFTYHDPANLEEALGLLARYGEDAKVLAGGQSLVPLLNFRLAHPAHLVDTIRMMRGGSHSMEGRGIAARYDESLDSFTVWASTQSPHQVRGMLAFLLESDV